MSHENVEALKRLSALEEAGDEDGAWAYFHPDVEWRFINAGLHSESGRGIDSLRKWLSPTDNPLVRAGVGVMGVGPADNTDMTDAGDYVISVDAIPGTDIEEASVYEFRDGKVLRCTHGYTGRADALKAVGREE